MNLHVIPAGPIQTNAYLLTDPARGEAVLIDAPGGIWAKIAPKLASDGVKLTELWITHGHWDHTQGAAEIVRETGAKTLGHRADKTMIETPEVMEDFMGAKLGLEGITIDQWVEEGDTVEALGEAVEIRHVPGHCPGNIMFVFSALGSAFVGDAIFAGSVGRTDLPGGSSEELAASIRSRIYTLNDETTLYPGHGPATTVAQEKATNPYVRP
ncbi:MBL fold metallo-hydrolase [Synoicihabitans lomoniglobus]|uniref:MBL fold metallo-hydrolase n=1 Tax=Synoicihabitans lomoniglobus TaxID=2909285 RepID=A0AAF0CS39_9BACT|nr:MBL fold metallo-hydrolase [Opitutaceae bacterium LMO-M01]WED67074.1 MBL fold metallo-hydrolase [Opitutaceae bacterium LMO-M01]